MTNKLHVMPVYNAAGEHMRWVNLGDNYLRLQISADAKTWLDAFAINIATGAVGFPNTPSPTTAATASVTTSFGKKNP